MNINDITVIICCAGMGTRLGIGSAKAIMDINGKPLILWQLDLLKDFDDIRIVVGYQADRVIEIVKRYRKDIMFAFNYEYENTGVAESLCKALIGARKYIIAIDGDVLINSEDFDKFINFDKECICYCKRNSTDQIYVDVDEKQMVQGFKQSPGKYEWTGIAKIESKKLIAGKKHVYEMLSNVLPIRGVLVRSRDIDTVEDYENSLDWIKRGYID